MLVAARCVRGEEETRNDAALLPDAGFVAEWHEWRGSSGSTGRENPAQGFYEGPGCQALRLGFFFSAYLFFPSPKLWRLGGWERVKGGVADEANP
jgi:hypothetical protein